MAELKVLPTPEKNRQDDLIERLERILEQARAGEVESFICAVFRPGRNWSMVFSGQCDTIEKVGILECMKADLLDSLKVEG